jgi:CBS domain containing-hemolysin-like protein
MTDDSRPSDRSPPQTVGVISRLLGALKWKGGPSLRDEIEGALAQNGRDAELSPQERAMLSNVLSLRTKRVDDVLIPRADIVAAPAEISLGELLTLFRTAGHSRLPVYGESLDDPRGMVHIRDFIDFIAARAEASRKRRRKAGAPVETLGPDLGAVDMSATLASARILRPVLYVPASMPAVDLLVRMQATRTHMALVIDEYGGTDGLVSIEDLVEIVVGDIEDEHDEANGPGINRLADGRVVADARAPLEEISEALGVDLVSARQAEDVDTLGGLIVSIVGRVPARGELIKGPDGLEFEVLDADPRRLKRVRIHRPAASSPASEPGAGEQGRDQSG